MKNLQAMNNVWDEWISGQNPPARGCIESRLARSESLVGIQVFAAN